MAVRRERGTSSVWQLRARLNRMSQDAYELYREDSGVLAEIGSAIRKPGVPRIEIRLPQRLADQAVAAWERTHEEEISSSESLEQATLRQRAATLALIGSAVIQRSRTEDEAVVVELDANLVGAAVDASDLSS